MRFFSNLYSLVLLAVAALLYLMGVFWISGIKTDVDLPLAIGCSLGSQVLAFLAGFAFVPNMREIGFYRVAARVVFILNVAWLLLTIITAGYRILGHLEATEQGVSGPTEIAWGFACGVLGLALLMISSRAWRSPSNGERGTGADSGV
jgi:hypothetical protein